MATKQQRLDRGWLDTLTSTLLIILAIAGTYEMRFRAAQAGPAEQLEEVIRAGRYPEYPHVEIRNKFTGIASLDYALTILNIAFLPGSAGFKREYFVLQSYFIVSFTIVVAVMAVEAGRHGSHRAWIWYTSLFGFLYQTTGGAIIVPVWFLLFLRQCRNRDYYSATSFPLPTYYAKALLPAVLFGYLLPTLAMYVPLPGRDASFYQAMVIFWQPSPLYVNALLWLFSWIAKPRGSTAYTTNRKNEDSTRVRALYLACFYVTLHAHLFLIYNLALGRVSLRDVFLPEVRPFEGPASRTFAYVFLVDFWLIFIAALVATFVATYDLRLSGKSQVSPITLAAVLGGGTCLVGPGAVIAGIFWWREGKLRVKEQKLK